MAKIDFKKIDTYRKTFDGILQVKKHVSSEDDLPVTGAQNGDIYTVGDSDTLYMFNNGEWGTLGSAGVTSATVTVDESTGTPSASVSVENGVLSLSFSGLKGKQGTQGNTGSSVDYPYELVNNLATDDATKGLSAAQGVVLDGKVQNKADRIYYALYKDSYIYKNTVYIDSLLIYKQGAVGREISAKKTFTVSAAYFLVINRETGAIRISLQNKVTTDEDILLISTGDGFYPTGKLVGDELANKWTDVGLTVAENGYGITNNGQKVAASGYAISFPVFLQAGTKALVTTGGYNLSALAKVESDGTYVPLIAYGDDKITTRRTSIATIPNSGYYVISSSNFATFANLAINSQQLHPKRHKVEETLVAGAVWNGGTQIGEVFQSCDGTQKKYFLSQTFLSINGETDKINGVSLSKDLPYYLLQYDKDFHYIGTSLPAINTTELAISCRYVKICAGDSSDRDYSEVITIFDLETIETPRLVYNGSNDFTNAPNVLFRTYELQEPFVTDNCEGSEVTTEYRGVQERIFNWGYIFLPNNYSRTGKPSPVIIHCHGTSGVVFNRQSLPYNTKYLEFLASCGYAVIGCSTFTSKYSTLRDDGDFPSPLAHSCYYNLWKYMTSEFNLDKSGAYIFGYSAGGMNTILLTQSKQIPIKAAAVLAGSVDLISNMRALADYCNEHFFDLIGLPGQDLPTGLAENGTRAYPIAASVKELILANKDKFTGRNPFNFNSDLDYWAFFERYASIMNRTNTLANDTILNELVEGARTYFNTPVKIWQAIDDANVPIQMLRWWRKMVMNGGGLCYIRELPAGCGAHYAVGYTGDESLTPMVDYLTPFGETINIPVAYAEMVDWFKRY